MPGNEGGHEFELGPVVVDRLDGTEPFRGAGGRLELRVLDFWSWAFSDLLNNSLRGVVAEFLVASALEADAAPRSEWDIHDIRTHDGISVEVKSAAYLQSWGQKRLSAISFDVKPKRGWDARRNVYLDAPARSSDVYVFCLLAHCDKSSVDPRDLSQWRFYVIGARELDERLGKRQRLSLTSLERLDPVRSDYGGLAGVVRSVASEQRCR